LAEGESTFFMVLSTAALAFGACVDDDFGATAEKASTWLDADSAATTTDRTTVANFMFCF
jgi:hypothetical protein